MELKQKGGNAQIGGFKQLKVDLIWTAPVDLDLMAFYKTKDGKTGGVYSDQYAGGGLGDLNAFPFIQLSGDAGLGDTGGDNQETLRISKLDDMAELYIVALNFSAASSGSNKPFAAYDARVEVVTDKGDQFGVPLDSNDPGSVALICTFKSDFMGASLENSSQVMDFAAFQSRFPGAEAIRLASKIVLKQKGDRTELAGDDFHATLRWKAAVDLDLYCFYRIKADAPEPKRGLIGKLFKKGDPREGKVYFFSRGSRKASPWIYLDQDAGVGDRGGDNEENIYFTHPGAIEQALIAANIFNKPNANFASYDGAVVVRGGGREVEVPLSESAPGSWCVIARIDNSGGQPQLININHTRKDEPTLEAYL